MSTRQFFPFYFIFLSVVVWPLTFFCELIPFKFRSSAQTTSRQNVQREKNREELPTRGSGVLLV
jgi:hypothetical protein